MATENFDVIAQLKLETAKGKGQLQQAAKGAKALQSNLHGATSAASGLWRQLVGVGAAYVGFSAVSGIFTRLTRDAIGYTASLQKMSVGLTSVLSTVENIGWEKASMRSALAFDFLKDAAVASPAGPQELFSIFQGIVGPIEAAGFSMQRVLDITMDTVSAASALNIDYAQSQRDISAMVRGAAGLDVKMFSLLRSTGAIVETTEDWNKKLTQAERVQKLGEALAKFRSAGDKYAKTWSGITATFGGILQEFGRAGMVPVMDAIAGRLDTFNDYLLANRADIEATIRAVGERAALAITNTFDRAKEAFVWITNNWDQILSKADQVAATMARVAPLLAMAYGGKAVYGALEGLGGGGGSGGGGGGALAGLSDDEMGERGYRKNKGGKWIDNAGRFAAGAAGAGAASGGLAGAGGLIATLSGPLAIALAGLAAVAAFASDHFQVFKEIWTNMTAGMGGELLALWESFKGGFLPLLKSWGGAIAMVLVPALQLIMFIFRGLVKALTLLFDVAGAVYGWIYDKLNPIFEVLLDWLKLFGEALRDLGKILGFEVERIRGFSVEDKEAAKYEGGLDKWFEEHSGFMQNRLYGDPEMQKQNELLRTVPAQRSSVTNDFRGSRITIKQDFKGKVDPDRVVHAMMNDLTKQAERRVSSGHMPAFSR